MPTPAPPLEGVRILDLGHAVAAPFATQWLAWMGAQVLLIESRKHPASLRLWPPFAENVQGENRSGLFNSFNCNKLSCALNLSTPKGKELVKELVRISDVVVENFSTGTMEKLGLDYPQLRQLRPDIILVSVSAFGRTGPMKDCVGYHSAVALFSGLAAVTGYPGGHPRIIGSVLPDALSATYTVLALLEAFYQRAATGQGQYVEVAMTEAMMSLMPQAIIDYTLNNRPFERVGNRDSAKAPHGVYPCGGEGWIAISVENEPQWKALCRVTGNPQWLEDPRFADGLARWHNQEALDQLLSHWTRQQEVYAAMRLLQQAGIPAGPTLSNKGLVEDPHLRSAGYVVTTRHPEVGERPIMGVPWRISDLPPVEHRPAPLLGQHVDFVLGELLGLPQGEIARLTEEGVIA